jgi:hypothetical protein
LGERENEGKKDREKEIKREEDIEDRRWKEDIEDRRPKEEEGRNI